MTETVIGAIIGATIGASVTLLLAIIGGIIWIVRKFGEIEKDLGLFKETVDKRFSLLEQRVKYLEERPIYKTPVEPGDGDEHVTEVIEPEIRVRDGETKE